MITLIKRPLITEKATQVGYLRQYVFEVETEANKIQIKSALKKMFNVDVESVRTVRVKGKNKTRNTKRGVMRGRTALRKKAYVTLKEGQTIDIVNVEGDN